METVERVTVYLLLICLCIKLYKEFHDEINRQRCQERLTDVARIVEYENTLRLLRFQESVANASKIQAIKRTIKRINEEQYTINKEITGLSDITVLVVLVHDNISYLNVFLDSIQHVLGINSSLLIFAHDYYDEEINSAIRNMKCARFMQIFYPYSNQLHPNIYPGEDLKFCEDLEQCYESQDRDPIQAQTKLFRWWVTSQVFDHISILKNYNGYIYFLETDMYLASDFIDMAKLLERVQKSFCQECRILSLGARPPGAELYQNNTIVKSIWGSNYNSAIGFNRTTWDEMRELKQDFCSFDDSSWENSLVYSISKSQQQQFFMLFPEAPHFFSIAGCGTFGNGSNCDLHSNVQDILNLTSEIQPASSRNFTLKSDNLTTSKKVVPGGGWGDARDIELCIFFTSKQRRYL